eukprot:CAMPEP_0206362322 /NCGR_PEP_ID=MMETSP0294-20121207/895_1 /ASSEMBLY_ACC=CAM_ASM_000327 /TAXON_ID=39354 /ORGANISM="Heterosigma akashiwo, Strain CCMP2393" /LENGTH=145 /DNA_ID=CAMNT_0053807389 /DNA_START=121 /DNA_END=555 /DNA_ORIENTATION=+
MEIAKELTETVLPSTAEDIGVEADPLAEEESLEDSEILEVAFEVESPTGDLVLLYPVSTQEAVMAMKLMLQELPETAHHTCYALVAPGGQELNDYAEVREYLRPGGPLAPGARLRMRDREYTLREVRAHVRRVRELLQHPAAGGG